MQRQEQKQVEFKNVINDPAWINAIDQTMAACGQGYVSGNYTTKNDPENQNYAIMVLNFPPTASKKGILTMLTAFNTQNKAQNPDFVSVVMKVISQPQPKPVQTSKTVVFNNITRNITIQEMNQLKGTYQMTSFKTVMESNKFNVTMEFKDVDHAILAKKYLEDGHIFGVNGKFKIRKHKKRNTKQAAVKKATPGHTPSTSSD